MEMPPQSLSHCGFQFQGYDPGDGRVLVSPNSSKGLGAGVHDAFFQDVFANLLHELVHCEHLAHGPKFFSGLGILVKQIEGAADEAGLERNR